MVVKLYHPYQLNFPVILPISSANRDLRRIITFLIITLYKYSFFLKTCILMSFLLINMAVRWKNTCKITTWCKIKFLLEGLECYKDTQIRLRHYK